MWHMVVAARVDTSFEHAYRRWLQEHIRSSKGERKRKLMDGLTHAEILFARQWWDAFGNFDHLHPQYEIRDFKDGVRFIDFAYIHAGIRLCIEVDPYGTHARNLTRWEYDDSLDRHNDLVLDEWRVLRFSLDQLKEKPRKCQQKLQQCLGKWGAVCDPSFPADPIDLAIIQFMLRQEVPLSPIEVAKELSWHKSTIAKHMVTLAGTHHLLLARNNKSRNTKYIINSAKYSAYRRLI